MKKYLFIIPLSILLSSFFIVPAKAVTTSQFGYYIEFNGNVYNYHVLSYTFDHYLTMNNYPSDFFNSFYYAKDVYSGYVYDLQSAIDRCNDWILEHVPSDYTATDRAGLYEGEYYIQNNIKLWIWNVPYQNLNGVDINDLDDPPEPEPGSSWLSDMWEWFLWQLGINDDYSGDIDVFITGGDRERMEYVTPTPSPTPTPYPSPTPYDLIINYPDGTSGTITGIPGSTTIINGGDTTNNYESDFDIFAVDVQIGDGGSSNPKDGLNSVMDASNDYLKDIDISPVQNSFSIIPNDWFLLIGVLAVLPFIAGFIMRLLK